MISVTGKFVFSVLLALSQYIVPYTEEQKTKILKNYEEAGIEVEDWQLKALNFEPKNIYELIAISGDERSIAEYIRTSCIRLNSATQSDRNIELGRFEAVNFELLKNLITPEKLDEFQDKIRDEEQEIRLEYAVDYLEKACDRKYSVDSIEKIAFFEADRPPFDSDVLVKSHMSLDQYLLTLEYSGAMREVVEYYGRVHNGLPQIESKDDLPYLPEISIVFDQNNQIIGDYSLTEYSQEHQANVRRNRRILTKNFSDIPETIIQAIVSVEDSEFYNHGGVDIRGTMRAAHSTGSGDSVQGASTITMQLAKNLLFYKDVFEESVEGKRSIMRKLREYILVKRLEAVLTKDEILEMYLNTIDFGRGVQGIVLAAKVYFGKELSEFDETNIEEAAFLAGLPKKPYGLEPELEMQEAVDRRSRVLRDMLKQRHITRDQFRTLSKLPINVLPRNKDSRSDGYSMHYVNAVQKQMQDWARSLNQDAYIGLEVTTPINHQYQRWAVDSLQRGLLAYERKRKRNGRKLLTVKPHEDQLPNIKQLVETLATERGLTPMEVYTEVLSPIEHRYPDTEQFILGVILSDTKIGLKDGTQVNRQPEDRVGQLFKEVDGRRVNLDVWDVVMLQPFKKQDGGTFYKIASHPEVEGAVVVIDNKTGSVLATAGDFTVGAGGRYKGAGSNRAFNDDENSKQPPGSTIKPFVYLYALNNGIFPNKIISNRNVTLPEIRRNNLRLCDQKTWSSSGELDQYTLHDGLVRSKNRLTINAFVRASGVEAYENNLYAQRRLEQGLYDLTNTMESFGLYRERKYFCYPVMLGAHEVSVVEMASAYSTIARDGGYMPPYTVNRIKLAKNGKTLNDPLRKTIQTNDAVSEAVFHNSVSLFRLREMLRDVVARGTAKRISEWSSVIGGKTGTVEACSRGGCKNTDLWFVGFNNEITIAVWVGYKDNKNMGSGYHGSGVALPIFKDFMTQYYEAYPEKLNDTLNKKLPGGLTRVFIESTTGYLIDDDFRSAFAYFTGRAFNDLDRLGTVAYVTEDERRAMTRYVNSAWAMSFFFDHLTSSKKAEVRRKYERVTGDFSGGESPYEIYQRNLSLCTPHLYTNSQGQRTWKPNQVSREVNSACRYVARNESPPAPAQNQIADGQLKRFYINNY